MDIVASGIGLLLLSPLFLVISIYVVVADGRPVIFRQERVGKGGRIFKIFKYKTMIVHQDRTSRKITIGNDKRITRSGQFIRKYKLDELPQLLNVFVGDMSLVGPRPELPCFVDLYPEKVREKVLSVRPGITDYASLEYKNENELLMKAADPEREYIEKIIPDKLRYYENYVDKQSFRGDISIILKTLMEVFK